MMKAPRRAYAAWAVRLQPDPLQLAVTLLQELDRPAPAYWTVEPRGTAHAVRRYGLAGPARRGPGKRR